MVDARRVAGSNTASLPHVVRHRGSRLFARAKRGALGRGHEVGSRFWPNEANEEIAKHSTMGGGLNGRRASCGRLQHRFASARRAASWVPALRAQARARRDTRSGVRFGGTKPTRKCKGRSSGTVPAQRCTTRAKRACAAPRPGHEVGFGGTKPTQGRVEHSTMNGEQNARCASCDPASRLIAREARARPGHEVRCPFWRNEGTARIATHSLRWAAGWMVNARRVAGCSASLLFRTSRGTRSGTLLANETNATNCKHSTMGGGVKWSTRVVWPVATSLRYGTSCSIVGPGSSRAQRALGRDTRWESVRRNEANKEVG